MSIQNNQIGQVYLWNNSLFVQLARDEDPKRARVRIGEFEYPLEESPNARAIEATLPLRGEFHLRKQLELIPLFQLDGAPTGSHVEGRESKTANACSDIMHLMHFKLPDVHHPFLFHVGPQISLKLHERHARAEVQMLAAIQRSDVEVSVRFSSTLTGQDYVMEVPLDKDYAGGNSTADFQRIVVQCPFKGSCTAAISVLVKATPNAQDTLGLCVIANAEIIAQVDSSELSVPMVGKTGAHVNGVWHSVPLRSMINSDGGSIELVQGDDKQTILEIPPNRITLLENFGHGITVRAQRKDNVILAINSRPIKAIAVSSEDDYFEIPSEFLTGEPIEVQILDLSASQVLFQMPFLGMSSTTSADVLREYSKAPYPVEMTTRQSFRYRGLKEILVSDNQHPSPVSLKNAIDALDAGILALNMTEIEFPIEVKPRVSVVIPAHNNVFVTYHCLCALLIAANNASFEVIVVDDGSTDATVDLPTLVKGVTFLRNDVPQRFIRACNAGVEAARGEYIALLNNDTEPTVGWLDALIRVFENQPDAGLVGAKLLYPDGKLQDAGGIIWRSGNPWNYGNRDNPWHPKYSYTRQVDYLSGAALMTSREIWNEVGALSSYLEPMYFEDTDFAFKVREAGYKTYFAPSSVVYHFEGMTSGTDAATGFKRYQEVNRPKFKKQWASAFSKNGKEGVLPDIEKDRNITGRVLFVDSGIPREDRDAGSYAARREMELFQSLGYKVTFLPENLANLGVYTEHLAESGVEVVHAPFYRSMRHFFAERGHEFDAVYMTRYHVAQVSLPLVREFCSGAKTILNNADLHFLRELRAAMNARDPNRIEAMREVRNQELTVMRQVDLVLSYNVVEHVVITSHTDGEAKVMECPWVVKIPPEIPPIDARAGISFIGSFRHTPNREGIKWFCQEIMPVLAPNGTQLYIYGADLDDEIRSLKSDSIHPIGYVENQDLAFCKHRIFVAPLLSGAGIKGKVISALASGIPTVLTPIAEEGIGIRHGLEAMIAETNDDWIETISLLTNNDDYWNAISEQAVKFTQERFSFATGRSKMAAALQAVDLFGEITP